MKSFRFGFKSGPADASSAVSSAAQVAASPRTVAAPTRRLILQGCVTTGLAAVLPLAACATFPFIPDHYTFTLGQLQDVVARRFPLRRQISGVFDLLVDQPVVGTRPDANRLAIAAHALISSPFLRRPVDGHFTVTSGVRYDAGRLAMVLEKPSIDQIDFPDLDSAYRGEVQLALNAAVAQYLDGFVVYQFKPDQLSFGGVHYAPGQITVEPRSVRVAIVEQSS